MTREEMAQRLWLPFGLSSALVVTGMVFWWQYVMFTWYPYFMFGAFCFFVAQFPFKAGYAVWRYLYR